MNLLILVILRRVRVLDFLLPRRGRCNADNAECARYDLLRAPDSDPQGRGSMFNQITAKSVT